MTGVTDLAHFARVSARALSQHSECPDIFSYVTRSASHTHKPLWIDTCNPFCLEVLAPLLEQTGWLLITEALPAVPTWPMVSGKAHVSELLVEMVL